MFELTREIMSAQACALAAQAAQSDLRQRERNLEAEISKLKAWDAEKQRYELEEIAPGIVCRALKTSMAIGEPIHRICANCYNNGKKSHLQHVIRGSRYDKFKCNTCGEELEVNKDHGVRSTYSSEPSRGGPNSWMGN